jgi:glutamine synthetase
MEIDDVHRLCQEHRIDTVECSFSDAAGLPRGKRIPARHFVETAYRGFDIANAALVWDRRCDILPEIAYANFDTGYPDMRVVPDLTTFRPVPWRPGAGSVVCDCLEEDGRPVAVSTRNILKSVVEDAHGMGYEPIVASELEFYLTDLDGKPLYDAIDCYSITSGAMLEGVLGRMRRELDDFGIVIEAANTEYGPAQVEVNIRYGTAVDIGDKTMLFKAAIKEIAAQEGCRAMFMPKPFAEQSGSGYHVHLSLTELDGSGNGGNVFAEVEDQDAVRACAPMRGLLGGLLTHAAALNALGSPTVNDFKRVQGYTFAPTNICWGVDNRTVTVRAIVGHGRANRIEWRAAGASANPYVVLAGCIAAGLDGIRSADIEVPPPVTGDAYSRRDLTALPETLEGALDELERSEVLNKTLGEFLEVFLALGRHEVGLWRAAVTDWELARYCDS